MAEFLAMGGYAAFVWPAYGITALVLIWLLAATLRALRTSEATLRALEGSRAPRRRARNQTGANRTGAAATKMGEG
jgi:heme exporter protein D